MQKKKKAKNEIFPNYSESLVIERCEDGEELTIFRPFLFLLLTTWQLKIEINLKHLTIYCFN